MPGMDPKGRGDEKKTLYGESSGQYKPEDCKIENGKIGQSGRRKLN